MYICKNCETMVPEGNKFCGSCGTQVNLDIRETKKIVIEDLDDIKKKGKTFNQRRQPRKKRVLIPLAIVGVLALVFLIYTLANKTEANPFVKTINVSSFINEPVFEGNDGEGIVDGRSLYLDEKMLQQKLTELLGEDKYINASDITSNFVLVADPIEDLSNGDTVTIVVEMRNKENIQDNLGIRFTSPNRDFKVIGLKDFFTLDPFDGFVPEFSGISPKVSVKMSNSKLEGNNTLEKFLGTASGYYDVYKDGKLLEDEDLAIGDTVTFKFNQTGIDRLRENAYKPTILEKEYTLTIADVPSYITSKSELDDALHDEIKTQSTAIMKSYLASKGISDAPKYEGMYFLTPKANGWQRHGNWNEYKIPQIYSVYSYQFKDHRDELQTKYSSVSAHNFIHTKVALAEGEVLDENTKPIQEINYENIKRVDKYNDYDSLELLFLDLVEAKLEYFSYEMSEGMKNFE